MINRSRTTSLHPLLRAAILVVLPLFLTGCSLKGASKNPTNTTNQPTLTIWRQKGATDAEEAGFKAIISAYKQIKGNENINVVYRAFEPTEDYEKSVINALAAGTGPDIWEIRDDELPRHKDKLSAIELTPQLVTYYQDTFAKIVSQQMISDSKLYGVPLGLDPLVLYYNSDHLQAAELTKPPKTWSEAIDYGNTLTVKANNEIIRPGFALGAGTNIDRASDVLQLQMLQFNTQMVEPAHKTATFDLYVEDPETKKITYPGKTALGLFSSFSHPDSPYRSWDLNQPYSTLLFPQGKLSMMINYLSLAPQLKSLNKDLQYQIARVPQWVTKKIPVGDLPAEVSDPVYFGHFDALVVSKPSPRLDKNAQTAQTSRAWNFINFAVQPNNNALFTGATGLLSPRMSSDTGGAEDSSNEIRKYMTSWYKGRSPRAADQIMLDMIKAVTEQKQSVDQSVTEAAAAVTNLLK